MATLSPDPSEVVGYTYGEAAGDIGSRELVRQSLHAYLVGELGWNKHDFEQRLAVELERRIPKSLFDHLEAESGWRLEGQRLLDVGAGQGATVHEALKRGAEAWGVEPSSGFGHVARVRLSEAGFSPARIIRSVGEQLPFPDSSLDYVVSLYVLEHVKHPDQVVREIERVLKPGGKCWISCENYLAFQEQHYRVAWLPLLPKWLGGLYLKVRGRDPRFLHNHVTYITYPRFRRILAQTDFKDLSTRRVVGKVDRPRAIRRPWLRRLVRIVKAGPLNARSVAGIYLHLRNLFRVGIGAELQKVGR